MLALKRSRWFTPASDWEVKSVTPPKAPLHRTTPTNGLQRGDWPPDVDATIAALAEQGVKRCRSEDITSGAGTTPATNGAIPDLLKDPFLSTNPDQARPAPADIDTAMPWLSSDADLEINPTTEESSEDNVATITLSPSPEPTVTPEAISDVEVEVEMAVDPTPQEPAAKDLLEDSWLRVQLQPDIKNPTDSVEPMGLINRIKGAFARSAGR